jgi:hypothetical protein
MWNSGESSEMFTVDSENLKQREHMEDLDVDGRN